MIVSKKGDKMDEYYEIVKDILNNEEFIKRKTYRHHGNITVYDHCLRVSIMAYRISKKLKLGDYKEAAIGGLLHDFYYKPWQENKEKKPFFKKHGFVHASEALENSKIYFPDYIDEKTENIILRHMFPLNIIPPKYKESWIVSISDKIVSLEAIKEPVFFLALFGIKK